MFSRRTDWTLTPNRFTQAQRELSSAGREVLDLTVSNPVRAGLHYDADAILNSLKNPKAMDYDPQPKGLHSAREAVAAYYREQHQSLVDPDYLVLTTSTSEGYSYVFRLLCNPDDEVLGCGATGAALAAAGVSVRACLLCANVDVRGARPTDAELLADTHRAQRVADARRFRWCGQCHFSRPCAGNRRAKAVDGGSCKAASKRIDTV